MIDLSIVICTYNRPELLRSALDCLLPQSIPGYNYEVVVVDNNSTPPTRAVVDQFTQRDPRVRYVRETRQGNAYARNTGVEQARAPVVAYLDDDVTVRENWLQVVKSTLENTKAEFIGGKVLPRYEQAPPSWLNVTNWAPIAALDYGDAPLELTADNPLCLLTANIAFRKEVFERFGGFLASVQRAGDSIGSLEDHEFLTRLFRGGVTGLYVPEMIVDAYVGSDRLTKAYHRRWHTGHGHFYAVMSDPQWERSNFRLIGVPGHLYRETARNALTWIGRMLRGNTDAAFANECRLRFFRGFVRQRRKQLSSSTNPS